MEVVGGFTLGIFTLFSVLYEAVEALQRMKGKARRLRLLEAHFRTQQPTRSRRFGRSSL